MRESREKEREREIGMRGEKSRGEAGGPRDLGIEATPAGAWSSCRLEFE